MSDHQTIVALETFFCPIPPLSSLPCPYTLDTYFRTSPSEVNERIAKATVVVTTAIPIRADALDVTISPHLRAIIVLGSGTNHVDVEACQKRGIVVMNSPGANTYSVAQHALTLLLATRRKIVAQHVATMGLDAKEDGCSQWEEKRTMMEMLRDQRNSQFPISMTDEVIGIIGNGVLGKLIANMCRALGMTVIIADRKNALSSCPNHDRLPFEEVLQKATAVVLCVPLTQSTENLISVKELEMMSEQSLLINVSRGDVVDEHALAEALKQGWIGGAATDVYAKEPASQQTSPLLQPDVRNTNLIVTPHLAWLSQSTIENYQRALVENLQSFLGGKPINVVNALV